MINQIYRIELTDNCKLDISIYDTNTLNPVKDIKELGVCIFGGDLQLDGSIDDDQLESLIKFLTDCKTYIDNFNKK